MTVLAAFGISLPLLFGILALLIGIVALSALSLASRAATLSR